MKGKINVVHICNLGMNGKAVFVCNLLEHTDFEKYNVTILNYRAEHADPIYERLEKLPVRIVNPEDTSNKTFLRLVDNYLHTNSVDVVHSHIWDLSGLFLRIANKNGVPIRVCHSHNSSKAEGRYNFFKEFLRDKVIWNVMKTMIQNNANRFAACSNEAAEWLFTPRIIRGGYRIISNGIDLATFSPDDAAEENRANKPVEIMFAGRMVYQKNPVFAVDVFSEFLKIVPSAHLTMIGSGKMESEVQRKIEEKNIEGSVTLVRQTNDMPKYYRNATVYLFPSNYEGLGITAIEAQACGVKVLASDAVPKTVQCGLVQFESLDEQPVVWAKKMKEVLSQEMHIDEDALYQYSIEATVKQIDELYGE